MAKASERYYWRGLTDDCEAWTRGCEVCQQVKNTRCTKVVSELQPVKMKPLFWRQVVTVSILLFINLCRNTFYCYYLCYFVYTFFPDLHVYLLCRLASISSIWRNLPMATIIVSPSSAISPNGWNCFL